MVALTEPEPSRQSRGLQLLESTPVASPLAARVNDVVQGNLAGCPVVATLAALASSRPARLSVMLGPPVNDDVFSKRRSDEIFRYWTMHYYDVNFPGNSAAVRISGLIYHDDGDVEYAAMPGGPSWPSLIEKAYAVWRGRGSYDRLDLRSNPNAPGGGRVMCDLVGRYDMAHIAGNHWYGNTSCAKGTADTDRPLNGRVDVTTMARRANRRPTVAASRGANTGHGIVSNHAYAVVGYHRGSIRLRNPHGGPGADLRVPVDQFLTEFQAVWQAR